MPNIGYNHRGIEKLCEQNLFVKNLYICSRVCGICNIIHSTAYTLVVEQIQKNDPPPRAKYLRVVANELERIHSHMIILAIMAEVLGFDSLFMLMMRDREQVMRMKEMLTGNRVLGDYLIFGGVKRDVDEEKKNRILKTLDFIEERMKYYKKVFTEDPTIRKRLVDVGPITKTEAMKHCLVGPTARGSGVKTDVRKEDPYDAYDEVPFNLITYDECDSWARMMVRIDEVFESINMVRYCLTHLPDGPYGPKVLKRALPKGEGISRVEAPRGELIYHMISEGKRIPYRVKIRTPSMTNIINGLVAFKNAVLADVPAIITSFDPCIACMERVEVIDIRNSKVWYPTLRQLAGGKR